MLLWPHPLQSVEGEPWKASTGRLRACPLPLARTSIISSLLAIAVHLRVEFGGLGSLKLVMETLWAGANPLGLCTFALTRRLRRHPLPGGDGSLLRGHDWLVGVGRSAAGLAVAVGEAAVIGKRRLPV